MHVESTASGRLRAFELGPTGFRRIAWSAAALLYLIVSTGAVVRLTASGLGCDHWPGCSAGHPFPQRGYHSYIEFGNRLVGALTIATTLGAWLGSLALRGLARWSRRLALAIFVGTLLQAPLGAVTVYAKLHPLLVMTHLLLSMAVLAGAVVLALEARGLERGRAAPLVPREVRRLGLALAAGCFALVVTGTFATAAGPHSGGKHVARIGTLGTALVVHAAGVAVFGGALLLVVGYLAARRREAPRLFGFAVGLCVLLLAQMGLGELQYRTHLPWGLVLLHVALAAAVWSATVAFVTVLHRPLASVAGAADVH